MATKQIGKKYEYSLSNRLGQGAFAEVYRGQNKKTGETVAIKVIKRSILQRYGDDMLKQIHCEIEVLQALVNQMKQKACPFINKIYECLETDNHIYIVLEFCDGGTLLDVLQKKKKLPEKDAVFILYQMVHALAFISENNTAHRDIKPENIFIKGGVYKLGDFGFAGQKQLYQTHLGTYPYMAPEFFNSKSYDGAIDVWALGCMFHEMLFGEIYFIGSTQYEVSMKILNKPYILKPEQQASNEVRDLLPKMIHKDKTKRISPKDILNHPLFNSVKTSAEFLKIMENERIFMIKFVQEQEEDQNSSTKITSNLQAENISKADEERKLQEKRREEELRRQKEEELERQKREYEEELRRQQEQKRREQELYLQLQQQKLEEETRRQEQLQQEERRRQQEVEMLKQQEIEMLRLQQLEITRRKQEEEELARRKKAEEDEKRRLIEQEKRRQIELDFQKRMEEERVQKENERRMLEEQARLQRQQQEQERVAALRLQKQASYSEHRNDFERIEKGIQEKQSIIFFMTKLPEFLQKEGQLGDICRYDIFYILKQLMVQIQTLKDKLDNKVVLNEKDHLLFANINPMAWELYFEDQKYHNTLESISYDRGVLLKTYIDYYNYMNNYTGYHYPQQLAYIQKFLNTQFQEPLPLSLYQPQILSTINALQQKLQGVLYSNDQNQVVNLKKAILWLYVSAFPEATFSGRLIDQNLFSHALETNNIGLLKQSINSQNK